MRYLLLSLYRHDPHSFPTRRSSDLEWLMIKHKDAAEDSSWNIDEHDGSALTGRTLEEIKEELPPKRKPIPIQATELQSRSEEHTSELQSLTNLVCRLLLEKKNQNST